MSHNTSDELRSEYENDSHRALELWLGLRPAVGNVIHTSAYWKKRTEEALASVGDDSLLNEKIGRIRAELQAAGVDEYGSYVPAYTAARNEMMCEAGIVPTRGTAQADVRKLLAGRAHIIKPQGTGWAPYAERYVIDLPDGWSYRPVLTAYDNRDRLYEVGNAIIANELGEPVMSVSFDDSRAEGGYVHIIQPRAQTPNV